MKLVLLITLSLVTLTVFAQREIKIEDAINHVGDSVKIVATIYGGRYLEQVKGAPTFLNVGGEYPYAPLTLVIWNEVRQQFYKKTPEIILKGKECVIFGKIELYKGKPEIIITSPSQIQEPIKVDVN